MTKRNTRRALLMSALSLVLCMSMLIGSTFAWFTDSVTSSGNKIQSGTLKLDLELLDKKSGAWNSIKEEPNALFDYDKWEPGYTEVKVLKVANEGNLALKWYAKFVSADDVSTLADAIDVYVLAYGVLDDAAAETDVAYPGRDLTGYTKVGTLAEFVGTIESTTYGNLEAEESAYLGLALKMREEAGNEYQGLDLAGEFDIMILATQDTVEADSFDDQYDANAEFQKVELPAKTVAVASADELTAALSNLDPDRKTVIDATGVTIEAKSTISETVNIPAGVTLKGATVTASSQAYLVVSGTGEEVTFEECEFEGPGFGMFVIAGEEQGGANMVFEGCTFGGQVASNFVQNSEGKATFTNCTFTVGSDNIGLVNCMGGTHIFNDCTFDYTGGSTFGSNKYVKWNAVNSYSENYSTSVTLNRCTMINCSTQRFAANGAYSNTLTINR